MIKHKTIPTSQAQLTHHPLIQLLCEDDTIDMSNNDNLPTLSQEDIQYQLNAMVLPVIKNDTVENGYYLLSPAPLYFMLLENSSRNIKVKLYIYPHDEAEKVINSHLFLTPALQYRASKNILTCLRARYNNAKKHNLILNYNIKFLSRITNVCVSAFRSK
ncbi:hypothetical protein [Photobacterium phosphoreum]|uniref:hypothetical protein n=1 Tax=Photobacterium phosphoreum TaxID=659 RepID=UPI000D16F836|nr:hypothetical protein [Photobacterium phosphoreum]PSU58203.1 hypothetical protein CTM80_17125 [Photobacterium phosphoreum]